MADQDRHLLDKLTPKQRQFLTLGGIAFLLFGVLWAVATKKKNLMTSAIPYGPFLVVGGLYYYLFSF